MISHPGMVKVTMTELIRNVRHFVEYWMANELEGRSNGKPTKAMRLPFNGKSTSRYVVGGLQNM